MSLTTSAAPSAYDVITRPRGLGFEPCFVCAEKPLGDGRGEGSCHENFAFFVASRHAGMAVEKLFADLHAIARMDFRENEPTRVQVKVAACRAHQPSLRLLHQQLASGECVVTRDLIEFCLPAARVERDFR